MANKVYNPDGSLRTYITTNRQIPQCKAAVDQHGGWIEDINGNVIHGKKPVGTVDITPTWRGILPSLIEGLTNGTPEGQRIARAELYRMANICDGRTIDAKE